MLRVRLYSSPQESICLGNQIKRLLPDGKGGEAVASHCILEKIKAVLAEKLDRIDEKRKRLVLALPGKTRHVNASNVAVDAILALIAAREGMQAGLLYGLGSHLIMDEGRINQLLHKERWLRIHHVKIEIHQQATKSPLPSRSLEIEDLVLHRDDVHERRITLALPSIIWNSPIIIVAGDTVLHPYEKRYPFMGPDSSGRTSELLKP